MYRREYIVLVRLDNASVHDHLIENEVRLLQIEHDVKFANVFEISVKRLNKRMDEFEYGKFVLKMGRLLSEEKRAVRGMWFGRSGMGLGKVRG